MLENELDLTVVPRVGQDIYVPSALHMSRGVDDFAGGLCEVARVWEEDRVHWVSVQERPRCKMRWTGYLDQMQGSLRQEFGPQRGRPDPDYRPEFNRW
jgi:hypothetical protein